MTLYPGFQKTVNPTVYQGYPGDLASDVTAVVLAANGLFAFGDVIVGNGCFLSTTGTQVASAAADAGNRGKHPDPRHAQPVLHDGGCAGADCCHRIDAGGDAVAKLRGDDGLAED